MFVFNITEIMKKLRVYWSVRFCNEQDSHTTNINKLTRRSKRERK